MPELPEVETVRQGIASHIVHQDILAIDVNLPRLLKNATVPEFTAALVGKTITAVTRKGKYILIHLQGDTGLLVHLRMTGSLVYEGGEHIPIRGEHIRCNSRRAICSTVTFVLLAVYGSYRMRA